MIGAQGAHYFDENVMGYLNSQVHLALISYLQETNVQVFIEIILICSCCIYEALFCIYCVFKVTSLYRPQCFWRSPRHIFIATFVLDYCVLWQLNKEEEEDKEA